MCTKTLKKIWDIHAKLGILKNKLLQLARKPDLPQTAALYTHHLNRYMQDLPARQRLEQQIRLLERGQYAYAVA